MSSFFSTLLWFVVALGVLITVHEFGHFWVARKLGVKVLRFSVGFGKPLWKRVGKVDGTEFVVASLPLGGYVKMLDEREGPVDEDQLSRAFNRKSLPVRSAIVAAGPIFNLLFAIVAYWLVFLVGDQGVRPLVGSVGSGTVAEVAGFQPQDELVAVSGRDTPTWGSAVFALLAETMGGNELLVRVRTGDGREAVRRIAEDALPDIGEDGDVLAGLGLVPWRPRLDPIFGQVLEGEAAARAGLQAGDRLISADGTVFDDWDGWVSYVKARPNRLLHVSVERGGVPHDLELHTTSIRHGGEEIGRIGAAPVVPDLPDMRREIRYGPFDAFGASLQRTWDVSVLMLRTLARMLTGQASVRNLSGPISIAQTAGKSADIGMVYFLKFLAVVSISLAILNLLPIPVLDGGHLLFYLIEAVKGGPLSEEAQMVGQRIGLAILLGLMTLAFYVDISRLLG
jgi:regulator of sigma E protease